MASALKETQPHAAIAVDLLTYEANHLSFTILSTLESALPDLLTMTSLTVHFVGAGPREIIQDQSAEGLLHMLPSLKSLQISYIGPRVAGTLTPFIGLKDNENNACAKCKAKNRSRVMSRHSTLYHQTPSLPRPDLIVLANSGFTEVETHTWMPTIHQILSSGVPAIIAAFTEGEAMKELVEMKRLGAKFIGDFGRNKWGGVVSNGPIELNTSVTSSGEERGLSCAWKFAVKGRS